MWCGISGCFLCDDCNLVASWGGLGLGALVAETILAEGAKFGGLDLGDFGGAAGG